MTRDNLPPRRGQETFDLVFGGFRYAVSLGRYPDGRIGEVFVQADRTTTAIEAIARDAAILMSLALQHGATPEQLRAAVTRDGQKAPMTIVGAVLDAVEGRG